jgi:hypothetical protein
VNSAAINVSVQVCLLYSNFDSFEYILSSCVGESDVSSIFSFLRTLHIEFHSGWTNLKSLATVFTESFFPAPLLAFVVYFLAGTYSDWGCFDFHFQDG